MSHSLLPATARARLRDGDVYRVISVRQPWAWAIIHAGKDVENRPRRTHYRGPLLIHASAAKPAASAVAALARCLARVHGGALAMPACFATGELVGLVDLVDCVDDARSLWAERNSFHLLLQNPRAVRAGIALRGQLGIWRWTVGTVSTGWTRKDKKAFA